MLSDDELDRLLARPGRITTEDIRQLVHEVQMLRIQLKVALSNKVFDDTVHQLHSEYAAEYAAAITARNLRAAERDEALEQLMEYRSKWREAEAQLASMRTKP